MLSRMTCLAATAALCMVTAALAQDTDSQEVQRYELSMDKITRYMESAADLVTLGQADPSVARALDFDGGGNDGSLNALSKQLASSPKVVATLGKHRLTPREYLLIALSSVQTSQAATMRPKGESVETYAAKVKVNPRNITLYDQHQDEIIALAKQHHLSE